MSHSSPIGGALARLRAGRGLTQAALAESSHISRVALGKIERGEVHPRQDSLYRLAEALGVDIAELVVADEPLNRVRFRAKTRVNNREQILSDTSKWLRSYEWLEVALGAREPFILGELVGRDPSGESIARRARAIIGISADDAILDVCGLLEDSGFKILPLERRTDAFFSFSVGFEGGGPAAIVNTWKRLSVERWVFSVVRELGHILLHRDGYDRARTEQSSEEERAADNFASHFLLPESGFALAWKKTRGLPTVQRVLKVKRRFRVSYKTVLLRLVESGRVSKQIWSEFPLQYRRGFGTTLRRVDKPETMEDGEFRLDWNRAGEPDGMTESDFVPDRFDRLVHDALGAELISLGRAAELLRLSQGEIRRLVSTGD